MQNGEVYSEYTPVEQKTYKAWEWPMETTGGVLESSSLAGALPAVNGNKNWLIWLQEFRENVLSNLSDSSFNRSICEVLLNQKFFNGIGNYLRAEILFRLGIAPFEVARKVLEPIKDQEESGVKKEGQDLLDLCHSIPLEVLGLGYGKGVIVDKAVAGQNCVKSRITKNTLPYCFCAPLYVGIVGKWIGIQIASEYQAINFLNTTV